MLYLFVSWGCASFCIFSCNFIWSRNILIVSLNASKAHRFIWMSAPEDKYEPDKSSYVFAFSISCLYKFTKRSHTSSIFALPGISSSCSNNNTDYHESVCFLFFWAMNEKHKSSPSDTYNYKTSINVTQLC